MDIEPIIESAKYSQGTKNGKPQNYKTVQLLEEYYDYLIECGHENLSLKKKIKEMDEDFNRKTSFVQTVLNYFK